MQSVEGVYRSIPVTIARSDFDETEWWDGVTATHELVEELSSLLPQLPSWQADIISWGEEDGDRIDIVSEQGALKEVFIRFDVRRMSWLFIIEILRIARTRGLGLLTEDGHLLRPTPVEFSSAVRRSTAARFVSDPEGFLEQLKKGEVE